MKKKQQQKERVTSDKKHVTKGLESILCTLNTPFKIFEGCKSMVGSS